MMIRKTLEKAEGIDPQNNDISASRRCLTCQKNFKSEHKFNRICPKCKTILEKRNYQIGEEFFGESQIPPSEWILLN